MTTDILLINPRRRKKRTSTKAKRRPRRRSGVGSKRTNPRRVLRASTTKKKEQVMEMARRRKKIKRRKNPSIAAKSYVRRAASSARASWGGLQFKAALKNIPLGLIGMIGSKWMAKRFGGGASETDPASWTYKNYLQGGLGSVATAFLMNMIKPGTGQRVLEGGLTLMAYEIVQNELISGNEWAAGQFGYGQDEPQYLPGDVEQDAQGRTYLLGDDNQWRELPEVDGVGALQPVGPLGALQPVGPLGSLQPVGPLGADPYAKAFLDN